jgi:hypothetical protein
MTQRTMEKEKTFFEQLKDALKRSRDLPKSCLK